MDQVPLGEYTVLHSQSLGIHRERLFLPMDLTGAEQERRCTDTPSADKSSFVADPNGCAAEPKNPLIGGLKGVSCIRIVSST
jgi:hypothetical protein